jgi:LacI family transcriptional regulator
VNPRVTQRELARLAKVSHTTVSLALRGHGSIPEKTRMRIVELARRHRYQPDAMLAALNAYRIRRVSSRFQGTLVWLTAFSSPSAWREMVQAEGYFLGAREQARRLGYQLDEFWIAAPDLSARRATSVLEARGVRGIIVAPLPVAHGNLNLEWSRFSAVALGYTLTKPQLHLVMNHQFRNMKHLVHHLMQLGYRRIGFAMAASTDERVDHNYLGGFWIAQQELPPAQRLSHFLAPDFNEAAFLRWFRRTKPDVVITAASAAYQVVDWLRHEGVNVPKDVGVAVASVPFGDSTISGIDENVSAVGAMAVDTLVGMIHRNEQGVPSNPWRILAEGTWAEGKTVRQRRS